jgi:hypothetical protein
MSNYHGPKFDDRRESDCWVLSSILMIVILVVLATFVA